MAEQVNDNTNYGDEQPAQSGGSSGGSAGSGGIVAIFTSPIGILRLVELLFCMIAFGAMADQDGYDKFDAFKFVVGANVLVFIWVLADIALLIANLYQSHEILKPVSFGADCLFFFLTFLAGIVGAAKCDEESFGVKTCENDADKAKAGIAFSFLTSFALAGSAFFAFRRWRS
jgi:Membrane-associating domain